MESLQTSLLVCITGITVKTNVQGSVIFTPTMWQWSQRVKLFVGSGSQLVLELRQGENETHVRAENRSGASKAAFVTAF